MTHFESWLTEHARRRPEHPALISVEGTLSFAELDAAARSLAAKLAGLGIRPGDRVAILMPNDPLHVTLVHALITLGAVLVPLNIRLTPHELRGMLTDSGARLLLHGETLEGVAAASCAGNATLVRLAPSMLESLPGKPASSLTPARLEADQSILFTSGTSGRPKGVRLGLAQHQASALGSGQRLGRNPADRWLLCMPLYHVGGLSIVLRSAIYGTTVLLEPRFDPESCLETLHTERATGVSLVPTMLERLLDVDDDRPPPATLRFALIGGGPISSELLQRARHRGFPVAPSYGLTEATSQVATLAPGEGQAGEASVGRALPGLELRVIDPQGQALPPDTPGEICVRGPQVMAGYWNLPEASQRVLRGGWLHTGDVGQLSAQGALRVLDRRDDLVVSGGENIYPSEVEAALLSHPDVAAVAVIGRADRHWGQVVHAFVVPSPGRTPLPEPLIAHCRSRLAGFKIPRHIHLVQSLPRTASGKLRRHLLRASSRD